MPVGRLRNLVEFKTAASDVIFFFSVGLQFRLLLLHAVSQVGRKKLGAKRKV